MSKNEDDFNFDWKQEKEKWQAKKAKVEYEKLVGNLIDANEVKKVAFETAEICRNNLSGIPDRLSHELAGESDPEKIYKILETEIDKSLNILSRNSSKF